MGNIGLQNLAQLLGQARADFEASVAATSTDLTLVLSGLNLGSVSMANGYVLLDAGALGTGTPKTLAQISSNTATTLTLTAALSAVPATGADLWLYTENTVQVVSTENIAQWGGVNVAPADSAGVISQNTSKWGGTSVEAADSTGVVPFRLPYSEATTGGAVPTRAVQVAGTDGTDLRPIATDSSGRLTPQPPGLPWDAAGLAVTANTNVFSTSYTPSVAGTLTVTIGNLSTGAASVAYLSKTANTAPTGGSAGTRLFAFNSGTSLAAGDLYTFQFSVTPNDSYNLQFGTATTVDITATFSQGQG